MKWIPLFLLVSAALAGCSGEDDPTATETGTTTSGTTTGTSGQNETQENRAPAANLTADVSQGEAPLQVIFSLNGTDDDGDALSWSFDADGDATIDQEGSGLPAMVNWTFEEVGVFVAVLNVTDGEASAQATFAVTVAEAGPSFPTSAAFDDPEGDAVGLYDILHVSLEVTATDIVMVMKLFAADAGAGDSPATYQLVINGVVIENYVLGDVGCWNNNAGEAAACTATRDATTSTVTITVARDYLAGHDVVAPYTLSTSSFLGEGQAGGLQEMDAAPDSGSVVLDGP